MTTLPLDLPEPTATLSPDGVYRYTLTRTWVPGRPPVVFVMLNPSTADATRDDQTIRLCRNRAMRLGPRYGSLAVVNLFAVRATDPRDMRRHPDPVGPGNDQAIHDAVIQPGALIIAAWGRHGTHLGRGPAVAQALAGQGLKLWCLGVTQNGQPFHPLRIPARRRLQRYEAAG